MLLDELGCHIASGALPAINSLVDHVRDLETVGVGLGKGIELIFENDIFGGNVSENEIDLGLVCLVLQKSPDNLEHGSNTGTSSNQGDRFMLVGVEWVLGNGAWISCFQVGTISFRQMIMTQVGCLQKEKKGQMTYNTSKLLTLHRESFAGLQVVDMRGHWAT